MSRALLAAPAFITSHPNAFFFCLGGGGIFIFNRGGHQKFTNGFMLHTIHLRQEMNRDLKLRTHNDGPASHILPRIFKQPCVKYKDMSVPCFWKLEFGCIVYCESVATKQFVHAIVFGVSEVGVCSMWRNTDLWAWAVQMLREHFVVIISKYTSWYTFSVVPERKASLCMQFYKAFTILLCFK